MKTIRGDTGDTFIRPPDDWGYRAVPVLWACGWIYGGARVLSAMGVPDELGYGPATARLCLLSAFWLIVFALICARIAWQFFGATKISASSDELVVMEFIGKKTISASYPIKLSTIRDVCMEEREVKVRGRTWHFWALILHLDDGGTHLAARFPNGLGANEFMSRCVRERVDDSRAAPLRPVVRK